LICDKIEGVLFVAKKNRGRRRNERRREEGRSSSHELNITNGFTDRFKSFNNFVCKNNTPSYFLVFFYLYIFTDRYNEGIFS
jgi:hypothetical protein